MPFWGWELEGSGPETIHPKISAFTELLSRTFPSEGYFGAFAVVLKANYRLYKSDNGKCKAHYTRFKFGNGGFYPSDVLCNGADSGFNACGVGFTVIYRILEFGNSACKGADSGCEASGGGFGTNYRTVMVGNMRCGAYCKRVEFGIDGRKES